MRPAVEDYLKACAMLSYLEGEKSPEAQVCEGGRKSSGIVEAEGNYPGNGLQWTLSIAAGLMP
ncbi:hypothetical protein D3H55_11005 [Bacillus salacetis]|uniref:Uncharacterized protein n=1 Tax=Bacillus salacetis TaxID=2315464 RepID=A0A3A1R0R4_9BACI|nr:hypothetical protein D3H55_11005 [Bacillus salacetis]